MRLETRITQVGKYLLAGFVNVVAGFILFLLYFKVLGWHHLVANVLVFGSWVWFGYQIQRRWTFQAAHSWKSLAKYITNQVVFASTGTVSLWFLVDWIGLDATLGYALSTGIMTVGMYALSAFWVFRAT